VLAARHDTEVGGEAAAYADRAQPVT